MASVYSQNSPYVHFSIKLYLCDTHASLIRALLTVFGERVCAAVWEIDLY